MSVCVCGGIFGKGRSSTGVQLLLYRRDHGSGPSKSDSPVAACACPCPISIRSVDKLDRFLLILSLIYKARKEVFLNTKAK